jgi:ADP-ribose pyrophosphatase
VLWEIPAGKLNVGEDPMQTAVRELEEECGIKATKVSFLAEVYPSPGYTNEIIRIFKVEDFVSSTTNFDEDEFLECEWVDLSTAKQMIKNGDIKDAKTLIALLSVL